MSRSNRYKWLIVVEGKTDANTYHKLLTDYGVDKKNFSLISVRGKEHVCNSNTWGSKLLGTIETDIVRPTFSGVILLVDTDSVNDKVFDAYKRRQDLPYVKETQDKENKGVYWYLDDLDGVKEIPIYGISVPAAATGCLETDLLASYGFPVEGQPEYENFVDIIKKSTDNWHVSKHGDGKEWWEENSKAKFDKFIYSALSHGFYVSGEKHHPSEEPEVIKIIKSVINGSVTN